MKAARLLGQAPGRSAAAGSNPVASWPSPWPSACPGGWPNPAPRLYSPPQDGRRGIHAIEFSDLWRGHPINESVTTPARIAPAVRWSTSRGDRPSRAFLCFIIGRAIRMGVALRRAGVHALATRRHLELLSVRLREEMHFINANQLANGPCASQDRRQSALWRNSPASTRREFYPKIFGRTGIICIQDYWRRSTDGDRPPAIISTCGTATAPRPSG